MTLHDLPAVNAVLNGTSALLLLCGYVFIRRGAVGAHRLCMLAAVVTSSVFLTSYLYYHAHVGHVVFQGKGLLRGTYLSILTTHTLLAVATVPLVLVTLQRALRARFDLHRKIARVTLPIWAYVSVTGVVVYYMLYRL